MLHEEAGIRWGGAAALVLCAMLGEGWARMAALIGAMAFLLVKDKTEPIWKRIHQIEQKAKTDNSSLEEGQMRLETKQKALSEELQELRIELQALANRSEPREPRWRLAAAGVILLLLINGLFMTLGILHADF